MRAESGSEHAPSRVAWADKARSSRDWGFGYFRARIFLVSGGAGSGLGQDSGWGWCRNTGTACMGQPGDNKGCDFTTIGILGFRGLGGLAGRGCGSSAFAVEALEPGSEAFGTFG